MRYAAASCLIAVGLLVGASGAMAFAQPSLTHHDDRGDQGQGSNTRRGYTHSVGNAPRTRVGSGRNGTPTGKSGQDGTRGSSGSNDLTGDTKPDPSSRQSDGTQPPSRLASYTKPTEAQDPPCPPGLPSPPLLVLFPLNGKTATGWTGFNPTTYFQGWADAFAATYQNFANSYPLPVIPPQPGPQPNTAVRPQVVSPEEPVVNSGGGGGGGGGETPAAGAVEPSVLSAPVVAAPIAPVVLAPPLPALAPPGPLSGTGSAEIPPRMVTGPAPAPTLPTLGRSIMPANEPVPADVGTPMSSEASSRLGYGRYLRTAGIGQLAAMALPGFAGILLMTAGGGFIGYRQAKAGHWVRRRSIEQFLY